MNIVDLYVVYGDLGYVGGGHLLGIFTDENLAQKASVGRGSLDCGGDGYVEKRKGVIINNAAYLFELSFPIQVDIVVAPNPRYESALFKIKVVSVARPIEFMRVVRARTGIGLREVKDLYDKVKIEGSAIIENMPDHLGGIIGKDEAIEWKQELNGKADIEILPSSLKELCEITGQDYEE